MGGESLSPERQEELRAAKSAEELERVAQKEGCELSVDMLEGAAGGYTNCRGYYKEDPHETCLSWCPWDAS